MELAHLNIGAVIFDVYNTLLDVGPAPADADDRWRRLWRDVLRLQPRLTRVEFSIACNRAIARCHEAARARGIQWPEVHWPSIVAEVVPELARLPDHARAEFLLRQIQTGRTIRMTDATARALERLKARPTLFGIASNAQAYTLRELEEALAGHGLGLDLFERDLSFWSFEHGFSKPDPHVFQILTARLAARGIGPRQTLMVGDRIDNDIAPARAYGWETWHLTSETRSGSDGDWEALTRILDTPSQHKAV